MPHISFDFWNTLAKPNPMFAEARTLFLADMFEVRLSIAKATYSAVKDDLDRQAEVGTWKGGHYHVIDTLCVAFGKTPERPAEPPAFQWSEKQNDFKRRVAEGLDALFRSCPPTIDPEVIKLMNQRATQSYRGPTFSIGSNTNFIRGSLISTTVTGKLPFAFSVFSDDVGVAKPNKAFFDIILREAYRSNPFIKSPEDVIHIGDHPVCDVFGAEKAGFRAVQVKDADSTASILALVLEGKL